MLGAAWKIDETEFSVFAPDAKQVFVKVYKQNVRTPLLKEEMTKVQDGVWSAVIRGNLDGKFYLYEIDSRETVDPYALGTNANAEKGVILDLRRTDPPGWGNDSFTPRPPIVWKVHVRDFSSDPYLAQPDAGKYRAFRRGVRTPNGYSALVDHIAELGVSYIHLLPVMDFAIPDENNGNEYNWGYDPVMYFSPEGSYSSDPNDAVVRIRELKELIMTLHSAGLGVILDVVYNHTYSVTDNALEKCAPGYYYRHDGNGRLCDGSGCGNETASEKKMFRRLMIDSVVYWAKEYHVDGFRFDLMGLHDVETMNEIRQALDEAFPDGHGKNILMYGEPWYYRPPYGIEGADVKHVKELSERIAIFNGFARDGIRGRHYGGLKRGFVEGSFSSLEKAMSGILGGTKGIDADKDSIEVLSPCQQILYCACHDDYTLFDHISAVTKDGFDVERAQRMAAFMLFSGLGIPFIQAGEEFLRTKHMDGNSYRSPDSINMLDWKRREEFAGTVEYYRGLIAIRRNNHVFDDLSVVPEKVCRRFSSRRGTAVYSVGNNIYCINNTHRPLALYLSEAVQVLADIHRADPAGLYMAEGKIMVEAHGVLLLHSPKSWCVMSLHK